jgi:hypothetical protein
VPLPNHYRFFAVFFTAAFFPVPHPPHFAMIGLSRDVEVVRSGALTRRFYLIGSAADDNTDQNGIGVGPHFTLRQQSLCAQVK